MYKVMLYYREEESDIISHRKEEREEMVGKFESMEGAISFIKKLGLPEGCVEGSPEYGVIRHYYSWKELAPDTKSTKSWKYVVVREW